MDAFNDHCICSDKHIILYDNGDSGSRFYYACKYCTYAPVCFKQGRFAGFKSRKARKMNMSELKIKLWAEEDSNGASLQND